MNCKAPTTPGPAGPPTVRPMPGRAALAARAGEAADFLKGLANPHRLLILCELAGGERSVGALIEATGIAQTSMSQHLAKLKEEGIVDFRRDHRTLHYSIRHPATLEVMAVLYARFCAERDDAAPAPDTPPAG
ncbi:ArsR/SmtB family transcription factor [Ancylobacter lacus]|uniref:ArsR/SmtB family transcription factor n=1 Tax=Ancylobacter lacus TaxID=2579970 RepID=UPI001FE86F96|nr:metalloregulator ArsR/SmtB family transcription factor [Ancylobacter lacus]